MKFLQSSIAILFISVFFVACEKDKDITDDLRSDDISVAETTKAVEGIWTGSRRYSFSKSIAIEFGFNIKANGELNVLDGKKDVNGSGTWTFDHDVFKAVFTTSTGEKYSVKSDIYGEGDKISGTWGRDYNETDGGIWNMSR